MALSSWWGATSNLSKTEIMDDTLLFIPPCCVDKKLPKAISHAPRHSLVFYTHGDVTMEKFYRAVSYLIADAHVMVLSIPTLSMEVGAFLQQCFEREWITDLVLSTRNKNGDIVERFLSSHIKHVSYAYGRDVSDVSSHLVLYSCHQAFILQGPMYGRSGDNALTAYTACFYPTFSFASQSLDWGNPLRNALLPDVLRHRQHHCKKHGDNEGVEPEAKSRRIERFLEMNFPPYNED